MIAWNKFWKRFIFFKSKAYKLALSCYHHPSVCIFAFGCFYCWLALCLALTTSRGTRGGSLQSSRGSQLSVLHDEKNSALGLTCINSSRRHQNLVSRSDTKILSRALSWEFRKWNSMEFFKFSIQHLMSQRTNDTSGPSTGPTHSGPAGRGPPSNLIFQPTHDQN